MDTVAKPVSDDLDLDALMVRVREAAMAGGTSSAAAARPQTGGKVNGGEIDLVRVLDAQSEWNEHTRQSLVALVECLQALRDDWLDANARVREEIRELAAIIRSERPAKKAKRPRAKGRSRRR